MASEDKRRERLIELLERVRQCGKCPLGQSRTNVVFGSGSAQARLMFVGEAPGYHEDQQGLPFVGQAGKLLEKLLSRISLGRQDVFIANVLKCRPPDNRDPLPDEISLCRKFLEEQIEIIRPVAICTLGNFSTKLLSGKSDGITRVRGRAQPMPGHGHITLFPVFHPAAALYTRSNIAILEQDFDRLGELLGAQAAPMPEKVEPEIEASGIDKSKTNVLLEVSSPEVSIPSEAQLEPEQLDLF